MRLDRVTGRQQHGAEARIPETRRAARRFRQKAGCALVAATMSLGAVAGLTVGAIPAGASTSLSQPVHFQSLQFSVQPGHVTTVTFVRRPDKYTKYEFLGKLAPLLKATVGTSKTAVAYFFTSASIVSVKFTGGVAPQYMDTWQFKSMSVAHRGVKPLGGDFLQSMPHQPYP